MPQMHVQFKELWYVHNKKPVKVRICESENVEVLLQDV